MKKIIFSLQRTGSTAYARTLSTQENIIDYGEIFFPHRIEELPEFTNSSSGLIKCQPWNYRTHKDTINNIVKDCVLLIIEPRSYLDCYTSYIISTTMTNRDQMGHQGRIGKYWQLQSLISDSAIGSKNTSEEYYSQLETNVTYEEATRCIKEYTSDVKTFIEAIPTLINNCKQHQVVSKYQIKQLSQSYKISKNLDQKANKIDSWLKVRSDIHQSAKPLWDQIENWLIEDQKREAE